MLGFLDSLEPVDFLFVFSDSFVLSSPLIYKICTGIKLVHNTLYANLRQASMLPWRPVRFDLLCVIGGRGGPSSTYRIRASQGLQAQASDHGPSESTRASRVSGIQILSLR